MPELFDHYIMFHTGFQLLLLPNCGGGAHFETFLLKYGV